jgi:hypothetical protein
MYLEGYFSTDDASFATRHSRYLIRCQKFAGFVEDPDSVWN